MSLAGKGAVAIWHDIAPEGRDVFYPWHGVEHMPERVGIQVGAAWAKAFA